MKIFGLRSKLIGFLILIITAVMGLMTYFHITTQIDARIEELSDQAFAVGQVLGLTYSHSLLTGSPLDPVTMRSTQFWQQTSRNTVYVKAYGVDGNLVASQPDYVPSRFGIIEEIPTQHIFNFLRSDLDSMARWDRDHELFEVLVPIRFQGSPFGVIQLGFDTTEISREQTDLLYQNIQMTGIFWAIVALVGLIATARVVSPIEKLVETTRRFGDGDLETRSEVQTGDEIEELADQFNKMASSIQRRIRERERSLAQLEAIQRVGTTLNDSINPEIFFSVLDEALETLYDIENFVVLLWDGEMYSSPYSRPESEFPILLPDDSDLIESLKDSGEPPIQVEPKSDWPEALSGVNLAYPLQVDQYLNGILFMKMKRELTDQEIGWMRIWGTQVSQAIRAMILNEMLIDYEAQPSELIKNQIAASLEKGNTCIGLVSYPDFFSRQEEEGIFFGEDLYDKINDRLQQLDYSIDLIQLSATKFILTASNLSTFEQDEIEQTVTGIDEMSAEIKWQDNPEGTHEVIRFIFQQT